MRNGIQGSLIGDIEKYMSHTFPIEIDVSIRKKEKELKNELEKLLSSL